MANFEELEKRLRTEQSACQDMADTSRNDLQDEAADAIRQLRQERDEARLRLVDEMCKMTDEIEKEIDKSMRAIDERDAALAVVHDLKEALRPFAEAAGSGRISFADPDFQIFDRARAALSRLEQVSDFGQSPLDRLHDAD